MILSGKIAELTGAKIISFHSEIQLQYLLLDSRKINSPALSLFFAIKGIRHDGHQFIPSLYQKGVRCFIIESGCEINYSNLPEANFWEVPKSIVALQQIVAEHRKNFNIPVIGITGSNGKTIIKEWLSQLLHKSFSIVKNPKSYNSQTGVPLSVWEMNEQHTLGIFEAGISQVGEMAKLEKIICPTLGIFTTIGPAHDEGFENTSQKVKEKLALFEHTELLFYRKDHKEIDQLISNYKTFSWSTKEKATVQIVESIKKDSTTEIKFIYEYNSHHLILPFIEEASVENILHCICVLLHFKLSIPEIQNRINLLQPIAMRLELKEGINGCYIIDDTYNNDLSGLTMAINFLSQQKQRSKKTIILSDLLESGSDPMTLYTKIAEIVKENGITKLIGIGKTIEKYKAVFKSIQTTFYDTTEDYLTQFAPKDFENEIILLKGARVFAFEKIVRQLQQKVHGTVLEINLDALAHNLNFYRSQLKPATKIMAMVKAYAYGSGSFEVASLLQFHRVNYLAVAYADEGVALRENGITLPIMVMNPSYQTFDKIIQYNLEPEIFSFKILNDFLTFIDKKNHSVSVHLKLDTGMKRLGFEESEIEKLLETISKKSSIKIASIFTHLAAADSEVHNEFTSSQLSKFENMANKIDGSIGYKPIRHALNSAGIVRFPEAQMEMVRLGIGLYGVEANSIRQMELQTVGTLKTVISQIKKIKAGESIGYSRKGIAFQETTIATIAIGYADGFDRGFSNGVGKVLVNGILCPIIGNVCMDMCMVDISSAKAEEGDEVIIFGNKPTIQELSKQIDTIPYEIITNIGQRVKRVFYAE